MKLADISIFENLQHQAHQQMGILASLSVFNGKSADFVLGMFDWDNVVNTLLVPTLSYIKQYGSYEEQSGEVPKDKLSKLYTDTFAWYLADNFIGRGKTYEKLSDIPGFKFGEPNSGWHSLSDLGQHGYTALHSEMNLGQGYETLRHEAEEIVRVVKERFKNVEGTLPEKVFTQFHDPELLKGFVPPPFTPLEDYLAEQEIWYKERERLQPTDLSKQRYEQFISTAFDDFTGENVFKKASEYLQPTLKGLADSEWKKSLHRRLRRM